MNRTLIAERLLWVGVAIALIATALQTGTPVHRGASLSDRTLAERGLERTSDDSLDAAVDEIVDGNLFRPDRSSIAQPATQQLLSTQAAPMPPSLVRPLKPALSLKGIVGGPPWSVILGGIPGRNDPIVLRQGQPEAGFLLQDVRRDTAVVSGMDTTWHLAVARAW